MIETNSLQKKHLFAEKFFLITSVIFIIMPLISVKDAYTIGIIASNQMLEVYYWTFMSFLPMMLVLGVTGLMLVYLKIHSISYVIKKPIQLFLGWILITFLIKHDFTKLYEGKYIHGERASFGNSLAYYFLWFVVFLAGCSLISKDKYRKIIITIILFTADFLAMFIVYHKSGIDHGLPRNIATNLVGDYTSVFCNTNHYAYFLTVVILLAAGLIVFSKDRRFMIPLWITYFINVTILILNNTFGSYLASIGGLIFLMILHKIIHGRFSKMPIILLVIFLIISVIANYIMEGGVLYNFLSLFMDISCISKNDEQSIRAGSGRWILWTSVIKFMNEKPISWITGLGIEGYGEKLYEIGKNTKVHNEFIEYLSFFGIPGLALYIWTVMDVFLHGLKMKEKLTPSMIACLAAAFGYLMSSFFGVTAFYTAPYFFIVLGLGYRTEEEKIPD